MVPISFIHESGSNEIEESVFQLIEALNGKAHKGRFGSILPVMPMEWMKNICEMR
jgi:hypothetical protein